MRLHHDARVVLLRTEMMMRFNVVVSHTIKHAHIGGVCGQTSFDSIRVMFECRRKTLPKVQQSHKVGGKCEYGLSTP